MAQIAFCIYSFHLPIRGIRDLLLDSVLLVKANCRINNTYGKRLGKTQ